MSVTRNMTTKMKNKMRASVAAAEASPPNPNTPPTSAAAASIGAGSSKLLPAAVWNKAGKPQLARR